METELIEQPEKKPLSKFTLVTGIITIFCFVVAISSIPFSDFLLECMYPRLHGNPDNFPLTAVPILILLFLTYSSVICLLLSICLAINVRQTKGGIKGYLAVLSCAMISISQMVIMSKIY